ncbi:hypothetical protein GC207_13540 [bacterium]|nr:hypothetical protein [bacterium]
MKGMFRFAVMAACGLSLFQSTAQAASSVPRGGRFYRGTGTNETYHSFVIPLDYQTGIELDGIGGNVTNLFPANTWTTTLYHYNATQPASSTNMALRIQYKNPMVAFGGRVGASPMYLDRDYRFGLYAGANDYTNFPDIYVDIRNRSTGAYIGSLPLSIPVENQTAEWTVFANNGYTVTATAYGLTTTVSRLSSSRWGEQVGTSYLITHRASSTATNYLFSVSTIGYAGGAWLTTLSNGSGYWGETYTIEFDQRPGWRAGLLDQPHFDGSPLPSIYYGKSLEELLAVKATIPAISFGSTSQYTTLDHTPELRRHPILDRFVSDMGNDPLALANYVVNEIETTDAIDYDTNHNQSASISLSGINRSALGVFQEGQGSPVEQCALLVYLLRQAGVPATFVFPAVDGEKMLDVQISRMLGVQVKGAILAGGTTNNLPHLVPVNYPWVAAYIAGESRWVHVFPWIKDIRIEEGFNLYDLMPASYNSGYKWMSHYLEQDPAIMSLAPDTDQATILFPKFVQNAIETGSPGLSLDDVGIKREQRKNNVARWDDFARPFSLTNTPTIKESFQATTNWFNTIQLHVYSLSNTNRYVDSGELKVADILNRRLLLRFQQVGTNNQHQMILSLAALHPGITNRTTFGGNITYVQAATNTLYSTDDKLGYQVIYRRLKTLGTSYSAPTFVTNFWEYLYDSPGQAKLGQEYNNTDTAIRKGDMVAFCLEAGRTTPRMLRVHAEELWQFEKNSPALPESARDPEVYLGTALHLMGMSFYERDGSFGTWLQDLHKVKTLGSFQFGFAMLKPKRDGSGNLVNGGNVIPVEAHLDIPSATSVNIYNGTAKADSWQDYESAHWDYRNIYTVSGSAAEHGVIESFFRTNAVSAVKLIHLAGTNNLVRLNQNNYLSYRTQIQTADPEMWLTVSNWFNTGFWQTNYSQGFVTATTVTNGSYHGIGAILLSPYGSRSEITSGINGGASQAFPDQTFNQQNAPNWRLKSAPDGSESLYTFAQNGINTDNFGSYVASQYQERSTFDGLSSQYSDPALSYQASRVNTLFGASSPTLQSAYSSGENSGLLDTHRSFWADRAQNVYDPVNAITGEHYVDAVDLSLNGPMPLQVRRNYSSLDVVSQQFGYGWKMSLAPNLTIITNGLIYAAEPDGSVLAYTPSSTNSSIWLPKVADNPQINNLSPAGVNSLGNRLNSYIKYQLISGTNVYQLFSADGGIRRYEVRSYETDPLFTHQHPYLAKWQDNRGNYFTFSYQEDITLPGFGQVRRVQSSNGDFLGFYYDVFGRIAEAYTGDGRRLYYDYDEYGDLTHVTLPDASELEYEYRRDSYVTNSITHWYSTHLISAEDRPDGRVLENVYDSNRRVITQKSTVGPDMETYTNAVFVYANNFNSATPDSLVAGYTLVLDAYGRTNRYDYTNSLITKITDPLGQYEQRDWYWSTDGSGGVARNLKSQRDKRGLVTEYKYDGLGNATNVTLRGNLTGGTSTNETFVTVMTYTNAILLSSSNSVGLVTKYLYSDTNYPYLPTRVQSWSSNTLVSVTTNIYYATNSGSWFARGLPAQTIRAYGTSDAATNLWLHNVQGRLTRETRQTGTTDPAVVHNFFYNARGELVEQTDAAGRTNRYDYDGLGRLKWHETIETNGVQLAGEYSYYNDNGELVWRDGPAYDPEDYVWRDYDGAGRPLAEVHWRAQAKTDGSGVEAPAGDAVYASSFSEHDLFGNLTRTVDPRGVITTNTWDSIGRLLTRKIIDTNGTVLSTNGYAYEPGGLVWKQTNALGGITETLYNSTGQPTWRKFPDGSTNGWRYYLDGRVQKEFQRNGAYWLTTYDDANRATTRVFNTSGGTPLATNVTVLDRRGNTFIRVDAGGNSFTNVFDGLDRLKSTAGPIVVETNSVPGPGTPVPVQQSTTNYFDASGVVTTNVNALGDKSITWTDALGRVNRTEIRNASNTLVRETGYLYATNHHGVTVTNGSGSSAILSTTFTDNDGNTVLDVGYPYSNMRQFTRNTFDLAGNRIGAVRSSITNSSLTDWATTTFSYDGMNRLRSRTDRDNALTTFDYDPMGNLTNRVMPGGLKWNATYDNAGQMLQDWIIGADGSGTRTNSRTYYATGNSSAGLLETRTNGRGITCTYTYDDWLRPATNTLAPSIYAFGLSTVWQYDVRGFATNITEQNINDISGTHPRVVTRRYDSAGQLTVESISLDDDPISAASLGWDAAGRRSALNFSAFKYSYGWRADGSLGSVVTSSGAGSYSYNSAGILTNRTAAGRSMTVTALDGDGRPLSIATKLNAATKLTEALSWTDDGLLSAHTLAREDFTDSRQYFYSNQSRRLAEERLNIDGTKRWTNSFIYDGGAAGGLGTLTKMGAPTTTLAGWSGALDAFSRINNETNNSIRRMAYGRVNGQATVSATLDGSPQAVTLRLVDAPDSQWPYQWRSMLEIAPGTHQLQVSAIHPSGQFTTNATSSFTNNAGGELITNLYSRAGMVTRRIWKNAAGTATNRTQILYWDAKLRLFQLLDYDAAQNGYVWLADYDGLDRRLRTRWYAMTNGVAQISGVTPKTISEYYDPQVEFLELGATVDGVTTWKLYGPDANGKYGGQNGTGGLDAIVAGAGEFRPVIGDARGNVLGAVTNGTAINWFGARPTGYGAVPGHRPLPLGHGGDLAQASAWRGRPVDITGFVNLGARPYNPETGSFESFDPVWNARDPGGYSFAGGDPINGFDPDGRFAVGQFRDQTIGRFYETVGAAQSLWGTVEGLYNMASHPIQTAEGLYSAATNPGRTYDAITDALGDTMYRYDQSRQGLGDDPYYHYQVDGAIKLEVAMAVLTGGVGEARNLRYADEIAEVGNLGIEGRINYGALDSLGRPTGVSATITEDMLGTGTRASQSITPPGYVVDAELARGHLLGRQLGGSGTDVRNLVTIYQNPANHPVMSGIEGQVRAAVQGGQVVDYSAFPVYEGANVVPRGITITGQGSGGFNTAVTVLNRGN